MYESIIDPQIQILERALASWESTVSTPDLSSYMPELTKLSITKSFTMVIDRLYEIKAQSQDEVSPFLIQTLSQSFPSWTTPLDGWITSAPSTSSSIYSHLVTMWSQLNQFDNLPNLPTADDTQRLVLEIKRLEGIASGYVKAISDKDVEFEEKRGLVLSQCNEIMLKATDSLEAAARKGLAVSFESRASEYDRPRAGWLIAFLASLIFISSATYCYILPQIEKVTGVDRLYDFLTYIPLTLPFLWLAWFSALRFSQLGRLKEDYKFKVATALALDGYRKQAEDLSSELQEKLLNLAISNFGDNPLRLMTKDSAKDAHPLAGIIDQKGWSEILKEGLQSIANKTNKW